MTDFDIIQATQIEQLAATLGAEAVHLVHLRQSKRWLVIVMWSADEMVRFTVCDTAPEAVEAAMKGGRVDGLGLAGFYRHPED